MCKNSEKKASCRGDGGLVNEHSLALQAIDVVTELCGEAPHQFLADAGMATGPIFQGLYTNSNLPRCFASRCHGHGG